MKKDGEKSFCIKANTVVLEETILKNAFVSVANGVIQNISVSRPNEKLIEYPNSLMVPGFIDLHTHGRNGNATKDMTAGLLKNYARTGTTAFLPSLSDLGFEELIETIKQIKSYSRPRKGCSKILGVHSEGPFIDILNRGGINEKACCQPDKKKLDALLSVGNLKYITVSPYVNGVLDALKYFSRAGVVCVSGHSRGNEELLEDAVNAGLKGICHWCNNNSPEQLMLEKGIRTPVLCDCALLHDNIFLEIICDLQHVSPAFIKLAYKVKGPGKIAVVSDSVSISGLPDGVYDYFDGRKIELKDGGIHELSTGSRFGSATTQVREFANLVEQIGIPLCDSARMCSLTPAEILGMENETGSISPGKKADFVLLDRDTFDILEVFIDAYPVFSEGEM
jgi:N-acetylglucosamine-6-phosphate deacetylase